MPTYQINVRLETRVEAKSDKVAVERAHDALNAASSYIPIAPNKDGWPGLHSISITVVDPDGVEVPT